jgi:hypothetical protein
VSAHVRHRFIPPLDEVGSDRLSGRPQRLLTEENQGLAAWLGPPRRRRRKARELLRIPSIREEQGEQAVVISPAGGATFKVRAHEGYVSVGRRPGNF